MSTPNINYIGYIGFPHSAAVQIPSTRIGIGFALTLALCSHSLYIGIGIAFAFALALHWHQLWLCIGIGFLLAFALHQHWYYICIRLQSNGCGPALSEVFFSKRFGNCFYSKIDVFEDKTFTFLARAVEGYFRRQIQCQI